QPVEWAAFCRAMETLIALRGPELLRVKGILNVAGCRGPVVVQYVQHLAHPPVELQSWPDQNRDSRVVFITPPARRSPDPPSVCPGGGACERRCPGDLIGNGCPDLLLLKHDRNSLRASSVPNPSGLRIIFMHKTSAGFRFAVRRRTRTE